MSPPSADLPGRFRALWQPLANIGRDPDGSYQRLAWSQADLACRAWFRDQVVARGLAVETDRNGNLWAWWGEPGPGAVVTGSHLDAVPGGGAYDGPLGVVSGLLAVDLLRERGARPRRPVAVAVLADEEGGRFGVACLGSRLLTGVIDPDRARDLVDAEGARLADVLAAARVDPDGLGRDDVALARLGCFVELHVEQGRQLVHHGAPVGLGTGVGPHGRWRFTLTGRGDHAGTTRLADRRDPMLPLAAAVLAAPTAAKNHDAVATVGRVTVTPNAPNAIAARVEAWLDCRALTDEAVDATVAEVTGAVEAAGAEHDVTVELTLVSRTPGVDFDAGLRERLQRVLGGVPELPTLAGHDAAVLAAAVPTAMLYVRNPTGVSHAPGEHATDEDCAAGIAALAAVLEELACR